MKKLREIILAMTVVMALTAVICRILINEPKITFVVKALTAILFAVDAILAKKDKKQSDWINYLSFMILWMGFASLDLIR